MLWVCFVVVGWTGMLWPPGLWRAVCCMEAEVGGVVCLVHSFLRVRVMHQHVGCALGLFLCSRKQLV